MSESPFCGSIEKVQRVVIGDDGGRLVTFNLYEKKKPKPPKEFGKSALVARTRFELVISALRGRRPKPLDERAMNEWLGWRESNPH